MQFNDTYKIKNQVLTTPVACVKIKQLSHLLSSRKQMADESASDIEQFLSQCSLFSSLKKNEITEITPFFDKISIPADTVLFTQGSTSDYVFVLIAGDLVSILQMPSGETKTVSMINPIETLGELSALSGEQRTLSIQAVTDCELLKISKESFVRIIHQFPGILAEVLKTVTRRSIQTIKLIEDAGKPHNAKIIVALTKSIPSPTLLFKYKEELLKSNSIFISGEDTNLTEIKKIIEKAYLTNQLIFIFLTGWSKNIFNIVREKLSHVYVLLCTDDRHITAKDLQPISDDLLKAKHVKFDLILYQNAIFTTIVNTHKWLSLANFNQHYHIRPNEPGDFYRVIRYMTDKAFVLVLGGGGIKGYVHVGVIKAILDKRIPIDGIGGTSIGSAVGACYIVADSVENMLTIFSRLKEATLASVSWRHLTLPMISMYSGNPATKKLINLFKAKCIEDLILPYFAVSANLTQNREVIHRSGLLWKALRSSCSVPGFFPPVVYNGDLLLDGGLMNNLPVDIMRNIVGAEQTLLASSLTLRYGSEDYNFPPIFSLKDAILKKLHLSSKKYVLPPLLNTFLDALLIGATSLEMKNSLAADIIVRPNLSDFKSFSRENEDALEQIGYRTATLAIEKHLKAHENKK